MEDDFYFFLMMKFHEQVGKLGNCLAITASLDQRTIKSAKPNAGEPMRVRSVLGAITVILATGASTVFATPIPIGDGGILRIANMNGTILGITTSLPCFNFGGSFVCTGATHQVSVTGVSTDFSIASSATDTIKDITFSPGVVSPFETVAGAGLLAGQTVDFDLESVVTNTGGTIGTCADTALSTCTPANSPFTLAENGTATQVTLSFTVLLDAYTGSSLTGFTPYQGVFTIQEAGTLVGSGGCNGIAANITNILNCEMGGGTLDTTWSAIDSPSESAAAVPEPLSITLLGTGLVSLGARRWRNRRQRG